jgi:hypothetical protein
MHSIITQQPHNTCTQTIAVAQQILQPEWFNCFKTHVFVLACFDAKKGLNLTTACVRLKHLI